MIEDEQCFDVFQQEFPFGCATVSHDMLWGGGGKTIVGAKRLAQRAIPHPARNRQVEKVWDGRCDVDNGGQRSYIAAGGEIRTCSPYSSLQPFYEVSLSEQEGNYEWCYDER